MIKRVCLAIILTCLFVSAAFADSIYGTCKRKDGSKVNGTAKITTSWNKKYAVPKNGKYRLDFGGTVGKKITIYVDGNSYTTIFVKRNTELNIIVP